MDQLAPVTEPVTILIVKVIQFFDIDVVFLFLIVDDYNDPLISAVVLLVR